MKTKFIFLAVIILATQLFSMAQGLTVTYLEQMKTPPNVASIENPQIKAAVEAKLRDMSRVVMLQSYGGKSIYKTNSSSNTNSVYKDFSSDKLVMQDMIVDKQFLITDHLPQYGWVIEKDQKEILGKKCNKAISQDGNIIAWFCSEIAVNDGPKEYWGCPGMILEVETNAMTITTQSIEMSRKTPDPITPATSGKIISKKDFSELKMKKMKEQGITPEGSNVQIIKM